MQRTNNFDLNVDQVSKLNRLLPKGYKIILIEQNIKRIAQLKKKSKIVYAPISQVLPMQKQKDRETVGRRNKAAVSYYEGGGEQVGGGRSNRSNVQDYQPQKTTKVNKKQWGSSSNNQTQKQFFLSKNTSLQMYLPPVFPSTSSKTPLTSKQILQQLEKHPKFYVLQQYLFDCPDRTNSFSTLLQKSQNNSSYTLNQLLSDMNDIFIKIYGFYPKASNIYNDSAQLESFMNQLITSQKNKTKSIQSANSFNQQQNLLASNDPNAYYFPVTAPNAQSNPASLTLSRQPSSSSTTFLARKKTTAPLKPDLKNITIVDKRILGQNIKKLPNECLPQICKIVYETLETREQYVIDIDMLPIKKVKQLQIYVMNCMSRFGEQIQDGGIDSFKNNASNNGVGGGVEAELTQESFVIQDDFD